MSDKQYEFGENEQNNSTDFYSEQGFEKAKDFKKSMKSMGAYSMKYLPLVIVAALMAVGSAVLVLLGPEQLSRLTDIITENMFTGIDLRAVANIGFFLIGVYLAGSVLSFLQGYILTIVTQRLTKRMRTDISRKINRLPMWFYNKHTTGDILSRITNDADTVGQGLNNSVGLIVMSLTMLVASLIMMFVTNWILALTAIGATAIGLVCTMAIMSKSQKYFEGQQKYLGRLNGQIEETYAGHTTVKAYNGEQEVRGKFIGTNDKLKKSAFKAQFLSGLMMPIIIFVDNLGYVAVSVVGAVLAAQNLISFGVIVAFIAYVRYFTQPLTQITQAAQALQQAGAAGERVFEFLGAEEMSDDSEKTASLAKCEGSVEFEHVRFGYEDSDKIIISDFSARALPGQKIAIVGPTGAGKTTLVNLLMRFHDVAGGDIKIDGVSIYDLKREDVRDLFCMVLQDTWLFEGTIKENVLYSKRGVPDEKVVEACKAVGLHHFIKTLPQGYDTVLGESVSLSEGQKQQITIARAIIQNAPMLILDEATSSVDTKTELHIQKAMDKLMQGRTSFVIAHRLSTIKNSDLILVLKDGDVIESGRHEKLLADNGFYAELYNSQFEAA